MLQYSAFFLSTSGSKIGFLKNWHKGSQNWDMQCTCINIKGDTNHDRDTQVHGNAAIAPWTIRILHWWSLDGWQHNWKWTSEGWTSGTGIRNTALWTETSLWVTWRPSWLKLTTVFYLWAYSACIPSHVPTSRDHVQWVAHASEIMFSTQRLANPPSPHNSWKSMDRSVNRGSSWCSSCATGLRLDRSRAPIMAVAKQVRGIGNDGDCKLIEWPDEGSWTSARTPQVVRRAANNCRGRPSVLWPGRKGYPALRERNGRSIIFKESHICVH